MTFGMSSNPYRAGSGLGQIEHFYNFSLFYFCCKQQKIMNGTGSHINFINNKIHGSKFSFQIQTFE